MEERHGRHGMKYRVEVPAEAWERLAPGQRSGEWQVITRGLEDSQRLYVEVWRYPWTPTLQVTVARIEQAVTSGTGRGQWRLVTLLRQDMLDLIEVPGSETG